MTVLIGRRELFAFAERYSSYRLKDYTDLADGVVLCSLFNLVFPDLRIRTASPQTYTVSQRTQMNWAALGAALDAVGIPRSILDREALVRGDTENGFSALVLFYFLFHLTKRTDFSAEFAIDVTGTLSEFLQSIESIAALVTGGALPLNAVPLQLQEQLSVVTAAQRHRNASKTGRRERVVQRKQSVSSLSPSSQNSSRTDEGRGLEKELSFNSDVTLVGTHPPADTVGVSACSSDENAVGDSRGHHHHQQQQEQHRYTHHFSYKKNISKERIESSSRSRSQSNNSRKSICGDAEENVAQREVDLQVALIAKSEECEELKMQNVQLLSQLARCRSEASPNMPCLSPSGGDISNCNQKEMVGGKEQWWQRLVLAEDELMHLRGILQNIRKERQRQLPANNDGGTFSEELLEDIVDAETGDVINVHETATQLNGVLLDTLRNSPRRRQEAQKWLWHIVSAYHVMETRLVTACDVAVLGWKRLGPRQEGAENEGGVECAYGGSSSITISGDSSNDETNAIRGCAAHSPSTPNTAAKPMQSRMEVSTPSLVRDAVAPAFHSKMSMIETEMERRRRQFEEQLLHLHTNEMSLRRRVQALEGQLRGLAQKAVERDGRWKSLCGVIHEAERTSFGIAEAETAEEVERLLAQRKAWYARADEESAGLMRDVLDGGIDASSDNKSEGDSSHTVCEAMQALVQSVTQDRDRLQKETAALRNEVQMMATTLFHHQQEKKQQQQQQSDIRKLEEEIRSRLAAQKEYEEDEVWFVRANGHPTFTLSSPSTGQTPSSPQPAKPVGDRDAGTLLGRNLSALLSGAVPTQ